MDESQYTKTACMQLVDRILQVDERQLAHLKFDANLTLAWNLDSRALRMLLTICTASFVQGNRAVRAYLTPGLTCSGGPTDLDPLYVGCCS